MSLGVVRNPVLQSLCEKLHTTHPLLKATVFLESRPPNESASADFLGRIAGARFRITWDAGKVIPQGGLGKLNMDL